MSVESLKKLGTTIFNNISNNPLNVLLPATPAARRLDAVAIIMVFAVIYASIAVIFVSADEPLGADELGADDL
eukprot:15169-Eustigmatos_ZCMA.PRE.1